jgi:hypothetical protein
MQTPSVMTKEEINNVFEILHLETDEQRSAVRFEALQPAPESNVELTLTNHTRRPEDSAPSKDA